MELLDACQMRPLWARSVRIGSSGVLAYLCDDVDRVRFFCALFGYKDKQKQAGALPGKAGIKKQRLLIVCNEQFIVNAELHLNQWN